MIVPHYLGDLGVVPPPELLVLVVGFAEVGEGRIEAVLDVGFTSVLLLEGGTFAAAVPLGFGPSFSLTELALEEVPEAEALLEAGLAFEAPARGFDIDSAGGGSASPPDTTLSSLGSVGFIVAGVSSTAEMTLSGFMPGASCDARAAFFKLGPDLLTKSPMAFSVRGLMAGDAAGVASIANSGIVSATALCFRCSFSCETVVFNSAILSESWGSLRLKLSLRAEALLGAFVIKMSVCGWGCRRRREVDVGGKLRLEL